MGFVRTARKPSFLFSFLNETQRCAFSLPAVSLRVSFCPGVGVGDGCVKEEDVAKKIFSFLFFD